MGDAIERLRLIFVSLACEWGILLSSVQRKLMGREACGASTHFSKRNCFSFLMFSLCVSMCMDQPVEASGQLSGVSSSSTSHLIF